MILPRRLVPHDRSYLRDRVVRHVGAHGGAPYKTLIEQGLWAHAVRPYRPLVGFGHSLGLIALSQKLQELALIFISQIEKHQGKGAKVKIETSSDLFTHGPCLAE